MVVGGAPQLIMPVPCSVGFVFLKHQNNLLDNLQRQNKNQKNKNLHKKHCTLCVIHV